MAVRVRVRLLGTVTVTVDDTAINLGPRQQRLVFAALAWEVDRLVAVDRLVDWVWPESPPRRASLAIQVYISRLRSVLAAAQVGPAELAVLTQGSGYVLRGDPRLVDAHLFQELVGEAGEAGDDALRLRLLDRALGLWGGRALADVATSEVRERLRGGLEEARLIAVEDRFDVLLRQADSPDVQGELTAVVAEHPTRERLVSQLMLALYRGGQPGRALEVYRRTRAHLSAELGIDPGPELRDLELAILRNDPDLRTPRPTGQRGNTVDLAVPALLPPSIADFTGRAEYLHRLDTLAERSEASTTVLISVIAGTAGAGKTALAVRWAHRVRARFPDGQLYANLDGYAVGPPLQPGQVLSRFLHALGIPPKQIPVEPAKARDLYRTLVADKRVLVLLDNAGSAEQVRPLLPAGPGCLVLVTSRNRLDGLVAADAARRITLDVLPPEEASTLLGHIVGAHRVAAEPLAAAELARTAAYLPLALRISAAQLANQPDWPIADYLADLRGSSVLGALGLDDDPLAVRAAFDLSYGALKPDARRAFRLMGLTPGPTVTSQSMAALADCSPVEARRLLDRLAATHLVDQQAPGRYGCHDLLRQYARELVHDTDHENERDEALTALFDHYLHTARSAVELLYPANVRLPEPPGSPRHRAVRLDDPAAALAWLHAERPNLVAVVQYTQEHGPRRIAWELADTLRGYLGNSGLHVDWFIVARAALAATDAVTQPRAHGTALFSLANAYTSTNRYSLAAEHYAEALGLYQRTGWALGEAAVHTNLGWIAEDLGRLDEAADHQNRAMELARAGGWKHTEAVAVGNLGMIHLMRGQLDQAAEFSQRALALSRDIGSAQGEAYALERLGVIAGARGRFDQARDLCARAVDFFRRTGATVEEASVLGYLATIHRNAGRTAEAFECATRAVALAVANPDRRIEAAARNALAAAHAALGRHDLAVQQYQRSLTLVRTIGARHEECTALLGLAAGRAALGRPEDAVAEADAALGLARACGYRLLEAEALTLLADVRT